MSASLYIAGVKLRCRGSGSSSIVRINNSIFLSKSEVADDLTSSLPQACAVRNVANTINTAITANATTVCRLLIIELFIKLLLRCKKSFCWEMKRCQQPLRGFLGRPIGRMISFPHGYAIRSTCQETVAERRARCEPLFGQSRERGPPSGRRQAINSRPRGRSSFDNRSIPNNPDRPAVFPIWRHGPRHSLPSTESRCSRRCSFPDRETPPARSGRCGG